MQITEARREKKMGKERNKDNEVESKQTHEYEKAREWNYSWKFRKKLRLPFAIPITRKFSSRSKLFIPGARGVISGER